MNEIRLFLKTAEAPILEKYLRRAFSKIDALAIISIARNRGLRRRDTRNAGPGNRGRKPRFPGTRPLFGKNRLCCDFFKMKFLTKFHARKIAAVRHFWKQRAIFENRHRFLKIYT